MYVQIMGSFVIHFIDENAHVNPLIASLTLLSAAISARRCQRQTYIIQKQCLPHNTVLPDS